MKTDTKQEDVTPVGDTTFGNLLQSRIHKAYTTCCDDIYGTGLLTTDERIKVGSIIGDFLSGMAEELKKEGLLDKVVPADVASAVISKRLRQAFSQIGGKSALANNLIQMMPLHQIYVEPFCGGAAVFFRKQPAAKEVLADLSDDVIFIYKAIQALTPENIATLQQRDWIVNRDTFIALREKYRAGQYNDMLDKLYTLLYLRHAVFGSGDPSKSVDVSRLGRPLTIPQDLADIQQRLANTQVVRADARDVIKSLDSEQTFFYLDPPYPVGTGQRKDYAYGGQFTMQDLAGLFDLLKTIKGKFLMSIPAQVAPYVPEGFHTQYVDTPVLQGPRRILSRELTVSNYDPSEAVKSMDARDVHVDSLDLYNKDKSKEEDEYLLQKNEPYEIIKADQEKRLLWLLVMKPYFVDYENQWSSPDTITEAAHRWLLNGGRIYMEHSTDISDKVKTVESFVTLIEQTINGRSLQPGTWVIVVWVEDDALWQWATQHESSLGASVRGMAALQKGKRPPVDAGRVK